MEMTEKNNYNNNLILCTITTILHYGLNTAIHRFNDSVNFSNRELLQSLDDAL